MGKTFFELGIVVHSVLEKVSRRMMDGGEVSEEEALAMLDSAWRSSMWESRTQEAQDREAAEGMVRSFLAMQAGRDDPIVGVEEWFDLEIEGSRVSGKIDRVDDRGDRLEVIDYKTGRSKLSRPKLRQDFQMVFYCEGAEAIHGKPVGRAGNWNLRFDNETMVEITPEEREEVLERAREVIRAVKAGNFEARPEYRTCMYCDYADLCDDRYS